MVANSGRFAVALWLSERDKRVHDKALVQAIRTFTGDSSDVSWFLQLPKRVFGHDPDRVDKLRGWALEELTSSSSSEKSTSAVHVDFVRHGNEAPMRLLEWLMSQIFTDDTNNDKNITDKSTTRYILAADVDTMSIMPILRLVARRHEIILFWYSESETSWKSETVEAAKDFTGDAANASVAPAVPQLATSAADPYLATADMSDDMFDHKSDASPQHPETGRNASPDLSEQLSDYSSPKKKQSGKTKQAMKDFSWQKTLDVPPQEQVGWGSSSSTGARSSNDPAESWLISGDAKNGKAEDPKSAALQILDTAFMTPPPPIPPAIPVAPKRAKSGAPADFNMALTLPTLQVLYDLTCRTKLAYHKITAVNIALPEQSRYKAIGFFKLSHMIAHMVEHGGLLKLDPRSSDSIALSVKGFCYLLENDGGSGAISALSEPDAQAARLLRTVILSQSPPLFQALIYAVFDVPGVRIRFNEPVNASALDGMFECYMGQRFVVYLKRAVGLNVIDFRVTDDGEDGLITISKALLLKCAQAGSQ